MSKYPVLFEANEKNFNTHGIGVLSDTVQCDITEEINGVFELNMLYPASGAYFKELKNNRIIFADASKDLGNQPFRIVRVTKLLNGLINVYAHHISYDLGGVQLPPFETLGVADGLEKVKRYSTTKNDFSFSSTVISDDAFAIAVPCSVRAYLMGAKDSFLQAYGGEFTFDRFQVRHASVRGSDKGFRIRYGVNMVDLNQEESIEKTYTGIFPYYKDESMFMDLTESYELMYPHEVNTSNLSKKIMHAEGSFPHQRIASVDLSPYFDIAPLSTDELKEIAEEYMENNKIGVPKVSLDVKYESLRRSPEYANVIFLEDVNLGDTVHVDFVKLGVSSTGRINSIIYDALKHRNKRVSIGEPKSTVADTVASITQSVKKSETNLLGQSRSIAKIDLLTNQNAANVEIVAKNLRSEELQRLAQDAVIRASVKDNGAKIELLVETSTDGENNVKGSVLVEAINGQSAVQIEADRVNLNGYVTINSLKAGGTTEIDGSRIKTGQILSQTFNNDYIFLKDPTWKDYAAGTYYFITDDNESKKYVFTTTKAIPDGGSIRFYHKEMMVKAFDKYGVEIETASVTVQSFPSGTLLDTHVSIYCSQTGTKIDLLSGEIVSPQFAIKEDGSAFFGGDLSVLNGRIGPFEISASGLYTNFPPASLYDGGFLGLYADAFDFISIIDGESWVSANMGDIKPEDLGGEQHRILFKNSSGNEMKLTPNSAILTGFKATPYNDPTKAASEIVTKQDLIDLGLINA